MAFHFLDFIMWYWAAGVVGLIALGMFGGKWLKERLSFRYQAFIDAGGWATLFPLHLQMSGWGLTPRLPELLGADKYPFYNWYNIPVPITVFGFPYDQGFLITNITHFLAGFLISMTSDLSVKTIRIKLQLLIIGASWLAISVGWELLEAAKGFRGSGLDTRIDLVAGVLGSLIALVILYLWDRWD
jgi:hypothetical protein